MLTELQKKYGPWAEPAPPGYRITHTATCDVRDRLGMVRNSVDVEWLRAVSRDAHAQKTVRLAAQSRLRKLNASPR